MMLRKRCTLGVGPPPSRASLVGDLMLGEIIKRKPPSSPPIHHATSSTRRKLLPRRLHSGVVTNDLPFIELYPHARRAAHAARSRLPPLLPLDGARFDIVHVRARSRTASRYCIVANNTRARLCLRRKQSSSQLFACAYVNYRE